MNMVINFATQVASTLILSGSLMLIAARIMFRLHTHTKKGKQYIAQPLVVKMQKASILLILAAVPIIFIVWVSSR